MEPPDPLTGAPPHPLAIKLVLWIFVALLGVWFLASIVHTLIIFGVATFITMMLVPLVTRATRWKPPGRKTPLSWPAAVGLVYTLMTLILVTGLIAAVPIVADQASSIAQDLPQEMPRLQSVVDDWQARFDRSKLPPRVKANIEQFTHTAVDKVGETIVRGFALMAAGLLNTFSGILLGFAAYLIAIFILVGYPSMQIRFYEAIPEPYRTDARGLAVQMNRIFGGFVRGMGILALCVGACNFLLLNGVGLVGSLWVDGLPPFQYTLLVSVLSMVAYLVPIAGIIITSVVAGLLAWFQQPSLLYVLVIVSTLLVGTNTMDRLLQPKVMSTTMGVSPLFVMFAACAGAELWGFWGMVVGVPAAAMVKSLWIYVYQRFLLAETLPQPERLPESPGPASTVLPPSLSPETPSSVPTETSPALG